MSTLCWRSAWRSSFRSWRLINFAHGEIMTFGGYGIFLALVFGFPPPAALIVGLSAAVIMALAMERAAFRAMRGADVVSLLITSFAVSEILKVLFQNGISARPVPIAFPPAWSGTYQLSRHHLWRRADRVDPGHAYGAGRADPPAAPHRRGHRHAGGGRGHRDAAPARHSRQPGGRRPPLPCPACLPASPP